MSSVVPNGSIGWPQVEMHILGMKNQPLPKQDYCVIANDSEAEESFFIEVSAISPDEARRVARCILAKTRRDHFSIARVLEFA